MRWLFPLPMSRGHTSRSSLVRIRWTRASVQKQTTVAAYFISEQLVMFTFALHRVSSACCDLLSLSCLLAVGYMTPQSVYLENNYERVLVHIGVVVSLV